MKSIIFTVVFLGASLSLANEKACNDFSQFRDVQKSEMTQIIKAQSATIVDVNSEDSFKEARIPGAIHYATNKKNFAKMLPEDKSTMIVAYCGGKSCTAWQKAAQAACEMGYKNIRHFSEGIKGWKAMSTKNS